MSGRRGLCALRVGVEVLPPRHWTLSAIVDPAGECAIGVHTDQQGETPQHVAASPQRTSASGTWNPPAGRSARQPGGSRPANTRRAPCTRARRTPWGPVSRSRTRPSRISLEIARLPYVLAPGERCRRRVHPAHGIGGSRPFGGMSGALKPCRVTPASPRSPRPSPAPKRTASRRITSHGLADPMIARFGIHEP